jgi:predicted transglutaminase-like cysteine proteinase
MLWPIALSNKTDMKNMPMRVRSSALFSYFPAALILFAAASISISPAQAIPSYHSYFVMDSVRSDDLTLFKKWTSVIERFTQERETFTADCESGNNQACAIQAWQDMLDTLRDLPLRQQLVKINDWANEHPYIIDQINWGVEDYWETPYEFMEANGDCEDYAIAKYYSLRMLGVSEEHLRIIIVQDFNLGGIIHAVLGVYDKNSLLVLDNQIKQVMPARKIYHYRPIYGVNEAAWWEYFPKTS